MDSELLTVAEAARFLRCSRGTILNLVFRNELVAIDIGQGKSRRMLRIPKDAIERLLENRRLGSSNPAA
jgi:excisionase family DNA binding protein